VWKELCFDHSIKEGVLVAVCAILPHEHNYDHRLFHENGEKVPYRRALTGYVAPFSVTGNPVVTMPLCTIDGKPLGIQVTLWTALMFASNIRIVYNHINRYLVFRRRFLQLGTLELPVVSHKACLSR
jgi:hypothetical protein